MDVAAYIAKHFSFHVHSFVPLSKGKVNQFSLTLQESMMYKMGFHYYVVFIALSPFLEEKYNLISKICKGEGGKKNFGAGETSRMDFQREQGTKENLV